MPGRDTNVEPLQLVSLHREGTARYERRVEAIETKTEGLISIRTKTRARVAARAGERACATIRRQASATGGRAAYATGTTAVADTVPGATMPRSISWATTEAEGPEVTGRNEAGAAPDAYPSH